MEKSKQGTLVSFSNSFQRMGLDLDNLIDVCSKKIREDKNHTKALLLRASSYSKKERYAEAIHDCDKLLEIEPNGADVFYLRGSIFERMGNLSQAISDYTQAIHIDPDNYNAAYARGACENRLGNYAKAIEDYSMALEKDKRGLMAPRVMPLASVNYILDSSKKSPTSKHAFNPEGDTESEVSEISSIKDSPSKRIGASFDIKLSTGSETKKNSEKTIPKNQVQSPKTEKVVSEYSKSKKDSIEKSVIEDADKFHQLQYIQNII